MSHMYEEIPLSTSNDEVRLLLLVEKRLYLQVFRLNDAPDYITVSYAWSEWTDNRVDGPQTINVNVRGQEYAIVVQPNIWLFLERAKENLPSGTNLWIDAICIDQNSIPDRTHQVGLMKTIYSNANATIVWLGEQESDTTELSYFRLDSLTQDDPEKMFPPWNSDSDNQDSTEYDEWRAKYGHRYDMSDRRVTGRESVHNLWVVLTGVCKVRYWTRLWAVQEFTLSKRIWIWVGGALLELSDFARAIYKVICLEESDERVDWASAFAKAGSKVPRLRAASDLCIARCDPAYRTTTLPNFELVYKRFGSDRNASDQHDCVYALLSLCQEAILPDYSKSLASLLWEILQLPANRDCVWLGQQLIRDMHLRSENPRDGILIRETVDMFTPRYYCIYQEWKIVETLKCGLNFPHHSLHTYMFATVDFHGKRSEPLYMVTKQKLTSSNVRVRRILSSVLLLLSYNDPLQSATDPSQGIGVLIGSLRRYQHIPAFPKQQEERLVADSKVLSVLLDLCKSAFRQCYSTPEHTQKDCILLNGQALGLAIYCETYDAALKYGHSDMAILGLPEIFYDEIDDD